VADLTQANVEKLRATLADLSPVHRIGGGNLSFLSEPSPGSAVQNLCLETQAGALDLLTSITGVGDYRRVRAGAGEVELFGRRYRVISLSDLIMAKRARGREKDLLSARELEAIAERTK